MSILREIKRRKMFQVAAVYLVVAWLAMQVIDVIAGPLRLPEWFPTAVIVLLAIGFPFTLILSWAFNITSEGVVRESDARQGPSGRTIEFVLIGLVAIAVVWLIYRMEFNEPPPPDVTAETSAEIAPNSIAVLPFENLSPDPDNGYIAAGIHNAIITELSKIGALSVKNRRAVLEYADIGQRQREIASELQVSHLVTGTVQLAGDSISISGRADRSFDR